MSSPDSSSFFFHNKSVISYININHRQWCSLSYDYSLQAIYTEGELPIKCVVGISQLPAIYGCVRPVECHMIWTVILMCLWMSPEVQQTVFFFSSVFLLMFTLHRICWSSLIHHPQKNIPKSAFINENMYKVYTFSNVTFIYNRGSTSAVVAEKPYHA